MMLRLTAGTRGRECGGRMTRLWRSSSIFRVRTMSSSRVATVSRFVIIKPGVEVSTHTAATPMLPTVWRR